MDVRRPTSKIKDNMQIVHTVNRGVDKRKIFMDGKDYIRFIHDMFEFNDVEPVQVNVNYYFQKSLDVRRPKQERQKPRKLLVDILAFCLMPNHYHLLLSPRVESGVALFMKKLNGGYAKYFNERYERSGALFQGRYKRVIIKNEAHFIHLPYYIHFNPLDLFTPSWREREIKDYKKALRFLEQYRWSSHLDYLGKKNFPSVTQRGFLLEFFGGSEKYKKNIKGWLKDLDTPLTKDWVLE